MSKVTEFRPLETIKKLDPSHLFPSITAKEVSSCIVPTWMRSGAVYMMRGQEAIPEEEEQTVGQVTQEAKPEEEKAAYLQQEWPKGTDEAEIQQKNEVKKAEIQRQLKENQERFNRETNEISAHFRKVREAQLVDLRSEYKISN